MPVTNDDGYVDVGFINHATFANQFVQIYKGPDYSLPANQHAPISVPLTSGYYQYLKLGIGERTRLSPIRWVMR